VEVLDYDNLSEDETIDLDQVEKDVEEKVKNLKLKSVSGF